MSLITQGYGAQAAPLTGGYGAGLARAVQNAPPAALDWSWWWQSVQGWLPWPAQVAPAPATWWSWWWAAPPLSHLERYDSRRGLARGRYCYRSAGARAGDFDVAATPLPPTPQTVRLRSHDKFVPFQIDFARDVASGDAVSAFWITVLAEPLEQEGTAPTDVTSTLLMGQTSSGTTVTAVLGNANFVPGTDYQIRVVATMASGLTLEQTIGDGPESVLVCDR
jgi:hypothetical protein